MGCEVVAFRIPREADGRPGAWPPATAPVPGTPVSGTSLPRPNLQPRCRSGCTCCLDSSTREPTPLVPVGQGGRRSHGALCRDRSGAPSGTCAPRAGVCPGENSRHEGHLPPIRGMDPHGRYPGDARSGSASRSGTGGRKRSRDVLIARPVTLGTITACDEIQGCLRCGAFPEPDERSGALIGPSHSAINPAWTSMLRM